MANNKYVKALDPTGKVRIYATTAEAARALELDASNIAKVLKGKRASAGGFKFTFTLEPPTTKAGKATRRRRREASEHKEFVNAVHDRLKELNQRYRNARKEGVFEKDPVLKKLMSHTDYFGATKTGGYNISASNLRQYSTAELENLLKVLRTEEHKYVEIAERKARPMGKSALAALFGISEKQVKNYEDVLPTLFDLLHLAREDVFFKYYKVQQAIFEVMQNNVDADVLQDYIDSMYEAYMGNDTEALEAVLSAMTGVPPEYKDNYD